MDRLSNFLHFANCIHVKPNELRNVQDFQNVMNGNYKKNQKATFLLVGRLGPNSKCNTNAVLWSFDWSMISGREVVHGLTEEVQREVQKRTQCPDRSKTEICVSRYANNLKNKK